MRSYIDEERLAHDELYSSVKADSFFRSRKHFMEDFEKNQLSPFFKGGITKGFVRSLAVKEVVREAELLGKTESRVTVLDAGCGVGNLSVYLACIGFRTVGIDISGVAIEKAKELASEVGVAKSTRFVQSSLDSMVGIEDNSIDFVVGHAALHHFIKYPKVPKELRRVLTDNGICYFADSFGENKIYSIFHDKKKMDGLGDVVLTSRRIREYFDRFKVELIPTDWFVMLDKLYIKAFPTRFERILRVCSHFHFMLDRAIPKNRATLALSGSVLTVVRNA
jgi:SAM-dependent methyltransferase